MNEPKPEVADDLPEQLRIRREKRESLLSRGIAPYPVAVPRTASLSEIRKRHKDLPIDVGTELLKALRAELFLNAILANYVLQRCAKVMALNYKQCFR